MKIDDITAQALSLFPNGEVTDDSEGQLVVYTGLYPAGNGQYALPKIKPRPSVEQMRLELTRYEIEEVFYTKDYQAMLEDNRPTQPPLDSTEGWRSEADIEAYFKATSPEEIEAVWEDTLNAFGEYESKGADV